MCQGLALGFQRSYLTPLSLVWILPEPNELVSHICPQRVLGVPECPRPVVIATKPHMPGTVSGLTWITSLQPHGGLTGRSYYQPYLHNEKVKLREVQLLAQDHTELRM